MRGKTSLTALASKAEKALKKAVHHVIQEHRQLGLPVFIWQNGKVVKVPASRLPSK